MEGAILSGLLAATAVSEDILNQPPGQPRPRQLTERRRNVTVDASSDSCTTPPRTMYVTKVATTLPADVEEELLAQTSTSYSATAATA